MLRSFITLLYTVSCHLQAFSFYTSYLPCRTLSLISYSVMVSWKAWENCKHIIVQSITYLLCSVNVMPENKLSLQELNQLIGIKVDDFTFHSNFWLLVTPNFQGGQIPILLPLHVCIKTIFLFLFTNIFSLYILFLALVLSSFVHNVHVVFRQFR